MTSVAAALATPRTFLSRTSAIAPGLGLCLLITAAAYQIESAQLAIFGKAWLETLVLAIVIGTVVRTLWTPDAHLHAGIAFSAKYLLEIAVVLLGASVSAATILAVGPGLLIGIAGVVAIAIAASFAVSRLLGLPTRMALLMACGNSICGNSAIAAVAPIIDADGDDVAVSIAFTAVLGVGVVLGLPLLGTAMGMSRLAYGAFAGLTVYAVPQVIAATSPFGGSAVQIGTLVKLVRVLMLGPVTLALSFVAPHLAPHTKLADAGAIAKAPGQRPSMAHLVPWFIIGFLALVACRSLGLVPAALLGPAAHIAALLTIISMAALGLGVDVGTVAKAGGRIIIAVVLCLLVLGAISLTLLWMLGLL